MLKGHDNERRKKLHSVGLDEFKLNTVSTARHIQTSCVRILRAL